MSHEKRAHRRYPIRLPARLVFGDTDLAVHTRDVSLGGMFLETTARPPYGAACEVRLRFPVGPELSVLSCVVRWSIADGVGVSFLRVEPREVWAINQIAALF